MNVKVSDGAPPAPAPLFFPKPRPTLEIDPCPAIGRIRVGYPYDPNASGDDDLTPLPVDIDDECPTIPTMLAELPANVVRLAFGDDGPEAA